MLGLGPGTMLLNWGILLSSVVLLLLLTRCLCRCCWCRCYCCCVLPLCVCWQLVGPRLSLAAEATCTLRALLAGSPQRAALAADAGCVPLIVQVR